MARLVIHNHFSTRDTKCNIEGWRNGRLEYNQQKDIDTDNAYQIASRLMQANMLDRIKISNASNDKVYYSSGKK